MIQHPSNAPPRAPHAPPVRQWVALAIAAATLVGCATGPAPQYLRQERALNDELIAKVAAGMSRDEVRRQLGTPTRIGIDRFTGDEEWLWRYTRHGYQSMCFYARFDRGGQVAGTSLVLETSSPDFIKLC